MRQLVHFSVWLSLALFVFGCAAAPIPTPIPTPLPSPTAAPTSLPPTATPIPLPTINASNSLPIFDTHAHYSRNSWSEYSPQEILDKLVRANVARALISSSPDEGTRRLYELDPVRIVPGFRPYHDEVGPGNWETSEHTLPYVELLIDSPIYVAFGEIHVHVTNIESPIFQSALRRALDRNLILHIHSDAETLRAVVAQEPDARILWAHAGLIESPETVAEVLDESPNVWTDISIREYSIAPNGALSDSWRALFLKHPDRITIGSDTWVPERWTSYEKIIELDRTWLSQLPPDIAERIAFRNAVELFGRGAAAGLE